MDFLEKIIEGLNSKVKGFALAAALIAGTTYFAGPQIRQDEKQIGLETHVQTILPQIKEDLEQEFKIKLPPTTRIKTVNIPELYPQCKDAPGLYDPAENTIYLDLTKTSYPCTSPFLRFMGQGNDNGKLDANQILRHELAHNKLDHENELKKRGSWPNFHNQSEEEIVGTQMLGEGFARCWEYGLEKESNYQDREEPQNLTELNISKNKRSRFTYAGGHKFVLPLMKHLGTERTIDFILDAFPPKNHPGNYSLSP
jgi:hypothetical protein